MLPGRNIGMAAPGTEVFLIDDRGWLRILIVVVCLLLSIYFHDLYSKLGARPANCSNKWAWWQEPRS